MIGVERIKFLKPQIREFILRVCGFIFVKFGNNEIVLNLRETVIFNEENVGTLKCGKKMSEELDEVFRGFIK